ncbi:SMP-30/gluconolactonase/LRE family protein [Spirillospora sp. CA-255316]
MGLEVLADGFGYVESPRWHDSRLWFSDFDQRRVRSMTIDGALISDVEVTDTPSGLAFLEDDVLVSSMHTQQVLAIDPAGHARPWADLRSLAVGHVNDMVLADSTLYVGCFGYDLAAREHPRPGPLLAVPADGSTAFIGCPDVTFANGMAATPDGRLLVAETPRGLITQFRIGDGSVLLERTIFADVGPARQPDGICLDAEGGVWFGSPFTSEFVRVDAAGRVTHVIPTPGRWAVACALGGPTGDTLFALTAETDLGRFFDGTSTGRVEVATAPVPKEI